MIENVLLFTLPIPPLRHHPDLDVGPEKPWAKSPN